MIQLELCVPNTQVTNNFQNVNGSLTLDVVEKTIPKNNFIFDRGSISIRNLNKTLFQIKEEFFPYSHLKFYLLPIHDKLIKDLEESEINFINIEFSSCAESSFLQGMVHVVFPEAIRYINQEREKNFKPKVRDLDELKNNSNFNNVIIDVLKEISFIQGCGNGGKGKNGNKCYKAINYHALRGSGGGQPLRKENDINEDAQKAVNEGLSALTALSSNHSYCNPPKKKINEEIMKIHKIYNNTIISNIIRIKIEGDTNFVSNLVLKIKDQNLNQSYINIYNLLDDCPQLNNGYSKKKITHLSQVIFMIVDRISTGNDIRKNFDIKETIYFDSLNGRFSQVPSQISYDLKFIIYHKSIPHHFIAYSKIRGEWYLFNDLSPDYAEKENPPLADVNNEESCSVCFYYVKHK